MEKSSDNKFAEQLQNLVGSICERVPAKFLIGHLMKYVRSPDNKKPKLNGDICSLIVKII